MKTITFRTHLIIAFLSFFILTSLGSCTAHKAQSGWMDLPHARELDHKKGNRSKHIQKHYAKAHHY